MPEGRLARTRQVYTPRDFATLTWPPQALVSAWLRSHDDEYLVILHELDMEWILNRWAKLLA